METFAFSLGKAFQVIKTRNQVPGDGMSEDTDWRERAETGASIPAALAITIGSEHWVYFVVQTLVARGREVWTRS